MLLLTGIVAYLALQIYSDRASLATLHPQWDAAGLAAALVSAVIAYNCLFLAWLILLRRANCFSAGHLPLYLRIWWTSYLYRYVPGKLLLVVERARMGTSVGIPLLAGAALTIVESLLAILAGSALSLLAVAYYAAEDSRLLVVLVFLSLAAVFLFPAGFRLLRNLPFVRARYPELAAIDLDSRDIIVAVLPYVLHYLLLGLSFFMVTRSLQLFSWSDLPGLCGIYALSHVVGLLVLIAPGGLGVRESALAIQLARFMPSATAAVLAIGIRVWFTVVELVCYVGVLAFCPALPTVKPAVTSHKSE